MRKLIVPVIAMALFCRAGISYAEWQVWTTAQTRHVLRDSPAENGVTVNLAAARNESRSFQILMRADGPIKGVNIIAADLRGPDGAVLRASDARLYRQNQTEITTGTYRNTAFKPGWYPDGLIPTRHPVTGEPLKGRIIAMPFDLPAGQTHGFWVDIEVPADAKAGLYRGSYRVTGQGQDAREIPVDVAVWDFTLPAVPTLVTAFGSPASAVRGYYAKRARAGKEPDLKDLAAVDAQCAQLMSEHRLDATPSSDMLRPRIQPDGSYRITSEQIIRLREFIDRYHVNAVQTPHPNSVLKDPERDGTKLHAWLAAFDSMAKELNRPQVIFYIYLKDEPNTLEDYRYVQKWGRAIRDAKSVVKVMVVEQPWTEPKHGGADSAWGDLYGAVDIWCPLFSLYREEPAAKRQALGESVWAYTALCQGKPTPWWHTDYPLLNYRVPGWIAWRYRTTGLLYWGSLCHWQRVDDPWTESFFFSGGGAFQHGDRGTTFYGEGAILYPARAVGYDGIAPSLRLKALRDCVQDYEYLAILQRLGKAAEAEKIVLPLAGSWFTWNPEPAAYDVARAKVAELIVKATHGKGS